MDANYENILHSFEYKEGFLKAMQKYSPKNKFLIIDSGAFSAWNKGRKIDLDEYIEFCKYITSKYPDNKWNIVNLDVIPGGPGLVPSQKEIDYSAEKGWDNYLYMQSKGIKPIHIFHQHEDFKWLKRIAASTDYMGVSPDNSQSVQSRCAWLKKVYSVIKGDVKTHGFACTGSSFLKVAPFYSADSSSWLVAPRFGTVAYFDKDAMGLKNYLIRDITENRDSYSHFKQEIFPKIGPYLGVSLKDIIEKRSNSKFLLACNIQAYKELQKAYTSLWDHRGVKFKD